jgi:hypothetical protein
MDILSKDTLKILSNANVRKGLNDLLIPSSGSSVTVTIPRDDSSGADDVKESQDVTLRRISA